MNCFAEATLSRTRRYKNLTRFFGSDRLAEGRDHDEYQPAETPTVVHNEMYVVAEAVSFMKVRA